MKIKSNVIILLLLSIFLQSFSFLSIKLSTLESGKKILFFLILALFFMGVRAIIWQLILKVIDLSTVYPFASLVQILILLYAVVIFDEKITIYNIVGMLIMLGGIYLLSSKKTYK